MFYLFKGENEQQQQQRKDVKELSPQPKIIEEEKVFVNTINNNNNPIKVSIPSTIIISSLTPKTMIKNENIEQLKGICCCFKFGISTIFFFFV